ncbi:MAG: DUF927 domain-containing protein [Planctomycetia bacterium]|nr:DUF927 domain-containing protein [Planctomycetia bacterium]
MDRLIADRLHEIEPSWTTGRLETFIDQFFRQLAESHASELAVNEVIKELHRTLKVQRGTAPTLPRLRRMYDIVAAAPQAQMGAEAKGDGSATVRVQDCLGDAPVQPGTVVPAGWDVASQAISRLRGETEEEILSAPLVISGRLTNIADGTEAWRLAWKREGQWHEHIVNRVEAASNRTIINLAAVGVPVTSNNAAEVVQYLADFEAVNLVHLPQVRVSSQMGWAEGMTSFLWGRRLIQTQTLLDGEEKEERPVADGENATDRPATIPFTGQVEADAQAGTDAEAGTEGKILFRGADTGDDQLADGFHPSGRFGEWRAAILPALAYPRVRLAVAASLSAPVLAILDLANFGVDLCGETSKGKTTTLRIAASVWGRPDEKSPKAAMSGWNSTRVWRERASTVLNNLPVILDETKLVKRKDDIGEFLYEMASGRGRGRGSLVGTQRTGTWHTVLLSSGEAPATSYSNDAGTKARVLTLWGSPFEKSDATTAILVKQLNGDLLRHYGHAGPRWVRFLLRHKDQWPLWRTWYARIQAQYLKKAGANAVVGRLADAFAVLALTGHLAGKALGLPQLQRNFIAPLWDILTAEAAEADRATEALRYAVDWASAHAEEFWGGRREMAKGQPNTGWAGHWAADRDPCGQTGPWEFVGFLPMKLSQVLQEGGFDYEAVVRTWRDRGWLLVDKAEDKKRYHQALVGDHRRKLICLTRKAVEALEGPPEVASEAAEPVWLPGAVRQLENKLGIRAQTLAERQAFVQVVREAVTESWKTGSSPAAQGAGDQVVREDRKEPGPG